MLVTLLITSLISLFVWVVNPKDVRKVAEHID